MRNPAFMILDAEVWMQDPEAWDKAVRKGVSAIRLEHPERLNLSSTPPARHHSYPNDCITLYVS